MTNLQNYPKMQKWTANKTSDIKEEREDACLRVGINRRPRKGTKEQNNTHLSIECTMEGSNLSLTENRKEDAQELWNVTSYDDVHAYLSFSEPVLQSLIISICTVGLVEAGFFVCSLGFRLKKPTPVTTYFLNLAVADFGLLTFLLVLAALSLAKEAPDFKTPVLYLLLFAHTATLYFLTAVSVERCLMVWFPILHRSRRPKGTSGIVSFLVWSTAGFVSGMAMLFHYVWSHHSSLMVIRMVCIGNVLILTPLVVVSSLIALVCTCPKKHLPRILPINRSLSLTSFAFFAMPVSFFYFMDCLGYTLPAVSMWIFFLLASLSSVVNPLIHYILGGQWERWRSGRT